MHVYRIYIEFQREQRNFALFMSLTKRCFKDIFEQRRESQIFFITNILVYIFSISAISSIIHY